MSTTAVKSPSHTHSHSHSQTRARLTSTTPRNFPHSVGQSNTPLLSPKSRSPQSSQNPKSASPSYFGFVVGDDSIPPDSNPGYHARQNWTFPNSSAQSAVSALRHPPHEGNPDFEAFRRQSEQSEFKLNQNLSSLSRPSQPRTQSAYSTPLKKQTESPVSPHAKRPGVDRSQTSVDARNTRSPQQEDKSFFDFPSRSSPKALTPKERVADHEHARLSLPVNELKPPSVGPSKPKRSDTLPHNVDNDSPTMVSAALIADLLRHAADVLLLDLRVYQQYANSRIRGALNLCIPTTLLKRPSFTTQKLSDTFTSDQDRQKFDRWRDCEHIVVYDANSSQSKEAATCMNVLKKFGSEGWTGTGLVIKGGFLAFSKLAPDLIDRDSASTKQNNPANPLSISPPSQDVLPVAGGCSMPTTKSAANPFFGNIRQNMDLLDGVGQMPIKKPSNMSERAVKALPSWLKEAAAPNDEGKIVSDRFLSIERSEQKRMQTALTADVQYGTPALERKKPIQVAGIEKGSKNRYNNILPYEHSRVRLQSVSEDKCDYVNASHVQATNSNRHYIATQAPIPATFNDFWKVVWEQDVRIIVMLTAEAEGGQVKSHVYWNKGEYGHLKVKQLSERQISLEKRPSLQSPSSVRRPSLGQRRSTTTSVVGERQTAENESLTSEPPSVWVRHFTLSHSGHPFQPIREITQIQYTQWPDFGAPASPTAILGLIQHVNKYVRDSSSPSRADGYDEEAAPRGQRPILVHCSAGCGRTGTFCTIDSVIDMLKQQRLDRESDAMDIDGKENDWVKRDDQDLVAKTVEDFRNQRLSMVQNLRQFVLCYESVLQWFVQQEQKNDEVRRSYQG